VRGQVVRQSIYREDNNDAKVSKSPISGNKKKAEIVPIPAIGHPSTVVLIRIPYLEFE
jgi:hypothetical protein